jgi:hypothetical protein
MDDKKGARGDKKGARGDKKGVAQYLLGLLKSVKI